MKNSPLLRRSIAALFAAGVAAAAAETLPVTGADLREAALTAARQRSVVEVASRDEAWGAAQDAPFHAVARSMTSDPLNYTRKFRNTEVSLDFCSGSHLLMTSNLDSVTELIARP
jgi:hypothetical protein